jgi:hypothetical protein
VHAVLTYKDVPRVPHTTAGQAWPEPSHYDTFLLDYGLMPLFRLYQPQRSHDFWHNWKACS